MSSDDVIKISNVSKYYQIYNKPLDRLKQTLFRGRKQFYNEFKAIDNVTFEIKKGETTGIIGRNGSGKSTLLQIICGTLTPTGGEVCVSGKVAALLELGAGFNPEFTGRENVYMNASILGLNRQEIDERFNDISCFADIGEFIDQPVKTYSSGMYVRLAFAVMAHVDADILVIDEALSVGDAFFVQKCMRFLRLFLQRGTIVFVSHDTGAVLNLCDSAILLHEGKMANKGSPKEITEQYLENLYEAQQGENIISKSNMLEPDSLDVYTLRDMRLDFINASSLRNDIELFKFNTDAQGFGKGGAIITNAQLLDEKGESLSWVVGGERVNLVISCLAHEALQNPVVGFQVKDHLGQVIFADNTYLNYMKKNVSVGQGQKFNARFEFFMPVLPVGDYVVAAAVADGGLTDHVQHHWVHDAFAFKSHTSSICYGLIGVPVIDINLSTVDET